jgi:hypothetical protein
MFRATGSRFPLGRHADHNYVTLSSCTLLPRLSGQTDCKLSLL